ncbi:cation transporter [Parabacteroides sp. OttesenSCG-928-G21]|nr:cation transporter [Parabacteroides sp. OttesenSCG-928-G21]
MSEMKFKTNAKCGGCVAAIRSKLNDLMSDSDWSIDLDSPDKILTVKADVSENAVKEALANAGFKAELL